MQPNSQAALASLQQAQSAAQDPNTILSGQRQQLGVDKAQETVTGLRGAINNTTNLLKHVAPSVMGRTASSLVTNAQAGKQIQNEQAPIAQNLSEQGVQYNQADQDLGRLEDRAGQAASGIYQGQQDKLSYAQNLYNTLYQKERDAQAAQQAEADRQEQTRQFNASLGAKSGGGSSFDLGGGVSSTMATADTPKATVPQAIYNQVKNMLGRKDGNAIKSEFNAITTSAGRGNQNDITKLKLLHDLNPELFNGRTNALKLIGL